MARLDPAVRTTAIAAVRRTLEDKGTLDWQTMCRIGGLYGVPEHTVYRWARRLANGENPAIDQRRAAETELPVEILALVAHHATLSGAHKAAVKCGLYERSYRQFLRDIDRLPPALRAGLRDGKDALIRLLPTMSYPLVTRNETWVLDHTQSDVRVLVSRSNRLQRPWVSIVKDKGTGVVVGVLVSEDRTRHTDVVGLLAAAMLQETGLGGDVTVGGRPESLLCDNGAENLSEVIVRGTAMLGITMLPTTPGHSWQNGSAENIIRIYQQQCEATLPGYVKGGSAVDGGLRFTRDTYDSESPDDLLTLDALTARALEWAIEYNRTPGRDGNTPLERWLADTNRIAIVSVDEVAVAMTVADRRYAVTKNGIHFRNREYQAGFTADFVGRGKVITVRYLPGVTDWIDCYHGDRFVGRAELKPLLSNSQQASIIRRRQTITGKVRQAEQESVRMRQAQAHADGSDTPVGPLERREPRRTKNNASRSQHFGGGGTSAREARKMAERQDAAVARFADIDIPIGRQASREDES